MIRTKFHITIGIISLIKSSKSVDENSTRVYNNCVDKNSTKKEGRK